MTNPNEMERTVANGLIVTGEAMIARGRWERCGGTKPRIGTMTHRQWLKGSTDWDIIEDPVFDGLHIGTYSLQPEPAPRYWSCPDHVNTDEFVRRHNWHPDDSRAISGIAQNGFFVAALISVADAEFVPWEAVKYWESRHGKPLTVQEGE